MPQSRDAVGVVSSSFRGCWCRPFLVACVAGTVCLFPRFAAAQTGDPVVNEMGAAFDTLTLHRLITRMESSVPETSARYHLLRGFARVRMYELGPQAGVLDSARTAFEHAIEMDGDPALALFGLGLTYQREPDVADALIATGRAWSRIFGFDNRSKARRAYERALDADPTLAGAAVGLGELALQTQDPGELDHARDALARTLATRSADPTTLIVLGRVAAALGDSATALSVANRLTVADAPTEALHSLLWVLAPVEGREKDVGEAFYRLVDAADAVHLDRLYLELHPILTAMEIAAWEAGDLEARRALLRGGWEVRATLAGTSVAERIAEHWRRLGAAVKRFPRLVDGPAPENALLKKRVDSPFDDRGALYVRHGEPLEVLRNWDYGPETIVPPACVRPTTSRRANRERASPFSPEPVSGQNESWMYHEPDGAPVIYHFGRCWDFPDFVLLFHVPCNGRWISGGLRYGIELGQCGPYTDERLGDDARAALASDSHRPHFDRQLPVIFDLLAFRGAEGRTDLVAPIAVAADSLTHRETGGQTVYGFDLTVAVVDAANGVMARMDTTILGRSAGPLPSSEMIRTHVELAALPSDSAQFRLTVRGILAGGEGSFYGSRMRVPDYYADTVQISSIVLAMPDSTGSWRRGRHSLTLMPLGQFEGGEFRVFYEVYGLESDRAYMTEIMVEPTGRRGPQPLMLQFEDFARPELDGVVRDIRRVETGLPPGRYRITVRVTDSRARQSARAEREFTVTARQTNREEPT